MKLNCSIDEIKRLTSGEAKKILDNDLEKEYAAYDFYMRVADTVDDHKTRNLLNELAGEEKGHINLLLREIEGRNGNA